MVPVESTTGQQETNMSAIKLIAFISSLVIIVNIAEGSIVPIVCGRHEMFVRCKSPCGEPVCNVKPVLLRLCLTLGLCRPGCICKKHFIRLTRNGPCVPVNKCPKHKSCRIPH